MIRKAKKSEIKQIKIPADPEGRGIFNPPTGNDGRGRASGYYTQLWEIKKFIDSFKEMDVIFETFSEDYYERILKKGILLVSEEDNVIVGVCFGTYNVKEGWADLLGLTVSRKYQGRGIGSSLVREFKNISREKKIKTIDLYADKKQVSLFRGLGYKEGSSLVAFRKKL